MKIGRLLLIISAGATLSACDGFWSTGVDSVPPSAYEPVLMPKEQLKSSITFKESQPLEEPGKMYLLDKYIFVNEKYKGVHVIDNADPANPVNIGFIKVPGCLDMAAKGATLYVDNATDLVAIDLNDVKNPHEASREADVFPEIESTPDGGYLPSKYAKENRPAGSVIVDWVKVK
jgi:hypothetical protein